ncbi:MAG: DUF488 domain-containing protein [Azospirillum sp.]|nr:DUF488 domain-containing protein [Azospirillum sp.]
MEKRRLLYTIGYENANIVDFIATLTAAGVDKLLDVREVTTSRRPGFSKNQLAAALALAGVGYVHLKGLGDPKLGREAARAGDMLSFRKIYAAHLATAPAQAALFDACQEAISANTCLMCYERDPSGCHRSIVADKIASGTGVVVSHIGVRDGINRTRQKKGTSARSGQGASARGAEAR